MTTPVSTLPVYLYDDPADVTRFLPFTQSRPIGELRYGAHLLRERVARNFGPIAAHLSAGHLRGFVEPDAPPASAALEHDGPAVFLRSSFVLAAEQEFQVALGVTPGQSKAHGDPNVLRLTDEADNSVGALMRASDWEGPQSIPGSGPAIALQGKLLDGAWQIIGDLVPALRIDIDAELDLREGGVVPAGCTLIGDASELLVDDGATVEPMVVFDTRNGPIWIQPGAEIRTFSRLAGPLVVGRHTRIVGGQLRESSIGPRCVVHGELSNSVFLGYANKSHDGFLGHSIVGRWANLGAGTITSNLKNTYGAIRLNLGNERIETGMQFLGSLIGDHVKTAIGTMLPTGAVIGTGANLFGSRRPESSVPAFAWGTDEPGRLVACRMFLQTASKVLPRREVIFDESVRRYLESVWRHCTGQPCE
jgi:UDP-N-acetylglucosamine diphosphorylase/glucosamine-1-phosphate N-acetyltransferase